MAARGNVVVCVDGRGTPGRGREFQNVIRGRLGVAELEDQADVADWLRRQSWVDPSRIMLWGKSYGGFMACMAAIRHPSLFRLCIAVAPVTDWRNYDTHYTERYMGMPEENPEGYRDCSPLHHAPSLGTRFLLVHGMADDNVHFQDAVLLVDALQRANLRFDFMPYPRSTHAFSGDDVGRHLYSTLAAYITDHL
jgi:dipeptidyl-peptidase-4